MSYERVPRVYSASRGVGYVAETAGTYNGGRSLSLDLSRRVWRPWLWWAVRTAQSMAARENRSRRQWAGGDARVDAANAQMIREWASGDRH